MATIRCWQSRTQTLHQNLSPSTLGSLLPKVLEMEEQVEAEAAAEGPEGQVVLAALEVEAAGLASTDNC